MENKDIYVLYFNTRDELLRVDLRSVAYFKADRNYTDVFFLNGVHLTLPTSLMAIEQMLDGDRLKGRTLPFVRIGRSLIVNVSRIIHINLLRGEMVLSDMSSSEVLRIEVPKEALKKVKDLFNQKAK